MVAAAFAAALAALVAIVQNTYREAPAVSAPALLIEANPTLAEAAAIWGRLTEPESPTPRDLSHRDTSKPLLARVELPSNRLSGTSIEFRIFRPSSSRFWIARPLGLEYDFLEIDKDSIRTEKGGFVVHVPSHQAGDFLFGEFVAAMPGKPKIFAWATVDYENSKPTFERMGGALFGSLLILAAFSVIVALLNRDLTFLLFSGWLLTSLRVAAVNGGWDNNWLNLPLQNEAYLALLRASMAAYGFFTVALFRSLFVNPQTRAHIRWYFATVQTVFALLVLATPWLAHSTFLRGFWFLSALSLGAASLQLLLILATRPSRVAVWYAFGWGAMIAGMLSEIGFQAGITAVPAWLNSQSASILSALMMGLALADRMKSEREARIKAQARSVKVLKQFEENYNSMPVGLFSVDDSGRIALHNPAFSDMFGARLAPNGASNGAPATIDDLLGPGAIDRLRVAATQGDEAELEFHLADAHLQERWFLTRVSAREGSIEGSIQEITVRKAAERQLLHLVDHDYLTGLLNRRGLEATLQTAIRSVADGGACAIAYVDLDRFKLINDLHGHSTGDTLLQQSAKRLQTAVRSRDAVARIADAFIVVFFDCPEHAVDGLTERVRQAIREAPFQIEDKGLNMTASVGVVPLERRMTTVDALAAADRACGEAKARGRDCVVRLTDQDDTLRTHLEELKVVADLQQRIPTDRYFLEFQPIVALQAAMSSLSYEVLIRMRGEQGQTIPPGKFIGAAERNGLMSQIDRWVLRSILEWLDTHPDHRDRLTFATLNISGASLNDTRFVDDAFAMIAEHPLSMPKLCFEITESVALHDVGSTRRFVDRVRMYGSKVALDDFGAGYTSFNYLKEIPADFIKIDGSFVKDINRNPANFAITRTIVDLTHELGMRSIAEWAETPDTIASLIGLGVDYGQGFGLVRPIAPARLVVARSGGELVGDPQVVALLAERARMHAGAPEQGARRRVPGHEAPPR